MKIKYLHKLFSNVGTQQLFNLFILLNVVILFPYILQPNFLLDIGVVESTLYINMQIFAEFM